jgi:hypothetical protein
MTFFKGKDNKMAKVIIKNRPARKVIDLKTIAKYKHAQSVIEAISDEDFKTKYSHMIVAALSIKSKARREKALDIIQKNMPDKDLRRVEEALDYYGYMYDRTERNPYNKLQAENVRYKEKEKKKQTKIRPVILEDEKEKEKKKKKKKYTVIQPRRIEKEDEKKVRVPIPFPWRER